MSLRDRLGRLTGEPAIPNQADSPQKAIGELRRKIDEIMSRRERIARPRFAEAWQKAIPLEHVVAGEEIRTQHGNLFVSRNILKGNDSHGHVHISDFACLNMEATAFLSYPPMTIDLALEDGLFLDTETTGLAGGTGTFPFLIGLGWFDAGSFITCQLFARDFSEEKAMLRYLSDIASDKQF
ncbi:MAG: ribonuclease H-like domain-containing protein, partial [Syntrophorhabdus sp.]